MLIETIDANPHPQYATASQRAFPRPTSFADDVTEASLMYQQMQMAARRNAATSQRGRGFTGLGSLTLPRFLWDKEKEFFVKVTDAANPTRTFIPNESAIVTEDQRDEIIAYGKNGVKAANKVLAKATGNAKTYLTKSVFWYGEAVNLAQKTLSMSYVTNGERNPSWQKLVFEAKDALGIANAYADKAKVATGPVATKPKPKPTPTPEPTTEPVTTAPPAVLKSGFGGTWWLVAGAAVVAFFAFRPSAKPEHLMGLEG